MKYKMNELQLDHLDENETIEFLSDGRVANFLLTKQIPKLFPEKNLRVCKTKSKTYIDDNSHNYLVRCFTRDGMRFMPSNQLGVGRKYNYNATRDNSSNTTIIACDISEFPTVNIKFLNARSLLAEYTDAVIHYKDRELIFGETST